MKSFECRMLSAECRCAELYPGVSQLSEWREAMTDQTITEGTLLWEPSDELKQNANISRYIRWLKEKKHLSFDSYQSLWEWSVSDVEGFWQSIWEFFKVKSSTPYSQVLSERRMPGAKWFPGAQLNYAEHVFRNRTGSHPALIFQSEITPITEVSWDELYRHVASVAAALRQMGIRKGDRVVSLMPNIPETIIAFLACASMGAIWSSCSPDFGSRSIIDRFKQIRPKLLFAVNGYRYGGKSFNRIQVVKKLQEYLPSLEYTVLVPYLPDDSDGVRQQLKNTRLWQDAVSQKAELSYEPVPFDHPMWILYSSGTTGLPKALVHSQGGILLEFLKFSGLHVNLRPGDRFFWFSTTGWVMWNIMQSGLLLGATSLLFDGSPGYPDLDVIWQFAENSKMSFFGTSAAYLTACMNTGMTPGKSYDLTNLRGIGSTGSPLPPEVFGWLYKEVKKDLWVVSTSGGTDPCTGFVGGCPLLPVNAGEIQCRCLGVKAEAFDEAGNPLLDQVGELVITEPMPSMPLYLWNDFENKRYVDSYFTMYPGVWRHGDWFKIKPNGSAVIAGRSDSTLNRFGVRFGSGEIYGAVEDIPEVLESLILGFEPPKGGYYMPLFVVLQPGITFDESIKAKINTKIRSALSPRHIPDDIFAVADIPKTLNGKRLEVPVKKILAGEPVEKAVNIDSMLNPDAITFFVDMARDLRL
jgi:acetoacetyl-CoA synthetase